MAESRFACVHLCCNIVELFTSEPYPNADVNTGLSVHSAESVICCPLVAPYRYILLNCLGLDGDSFSGIVRSVISTSLDITSEIYPSYKAQSCSQFLYIPEESLFINRQLSIAVADGEVMAAARAVILV